jgi:hypothetical protein
MLFLAISGLLFAAIIFGTGSSISIQRYRDSVSSLQSILQQQFTEVTNVTNDNTTVDCGSNTIQNRGQTDCVVLGKFITYSGGNSLSIQTVIGNPVRSVDNTSDLTVFNQYDFTLTTSEPYSIEWNALIKDKNNNSMKFSILMLRSPLSGTVRTFIDITTDSILGPNIPAKLINSTALNVTKAELCIDPNGLTTNKQIEILINTGASNSAAIETIGDAGAGYVCH